MSPNAGGVPALQVLCLSGSLRQRSGNTALLHAAASLAPPSLQLTVYDGLGCLPLFNPDDEARALPASVATLREQVGRCDAVLVACPEYAHGIPGAFKNLLDWLVGSLEFPGKPVAQWNASARDSHHAQDALKEVLQTMAAHWLAPASTTLPLPGAGCEVGDILGDASQCARIEQALAALQASLMASR